MVAEFFVENFIVLFLILVFLTIALCASKVKIKGFRYFVMVLVITVILVVTQFVERQAALDEKYRTLRLFVSVAGYCMRPAAAMAMLFICIPSRKYKMLLSIPEAINILVFSTAFFSKLAFFYDENYNFVRGPLGVTVFIVGAFYLIAAVVVSVSRYRKGRIGDAQNLSLIVIGYSLATAMDVLLGTSYLNAVIVISAFLYYIYLRAQYNQENEARQVRELNEQLAIVSALGKDFLNVFLVNPEKNVCRVLKLDGYVTTGVNKDKSQLYDYRALCAQYISERVYSEDASMLTEAMSAQAIVRELGDKDEYVKNYRVLIDDQIHYFQFRYLKVPGLGYVIAGFQNIDETIAAEKIQQQKLQDALDAAEHSNRSKTVFLSSMSHDIRTPMNAIIGFTDMAQNHIDDREKVRGCLEKIDSSSKHLLNLINDVLDMSRIESGQVRIREKICSIVDVVNDISDMFRPDITQKQQEFEVSLDNIKNSTVICDRLRLNQVLINVLSNSVKYTKNGGKIIFEILEKPCEREGFANYEFTIEDNGVGVDEEFMKHIYEPFTREETSTISGIQGTGLGLAITKKIVDLMGGEISMVSTPGIGSRTTLRFCFMIGETKEVKERKDYENNITAKRALLVEDNPLNREIAIMILKDAGILVECAVDGQEAVLMFDASENGYYDVILMDIQMPVMDGYTATRKIRELNRPDAKNVPIIAMTANAFDEDRQMALEAGMNEHLTKPFKKERLLSILSTQTGGRDDT